MPQLPRIYVVKDHVVKEDCRYQLFEGFNVNGLDAIYLALSRYKELTISLLRQEVPNVHFEASKIFVDIYRVLEHGRSYLTAQFWSQSRSHCLFMSQDTEEIWKQALGVSTVSFY